ncbi:hypothetical protein [Corallococcus terminator]|uniref:Uncharacterized protein n=1 Tax=Corallococcus terminator TaxID=2316733 RepID=A0A3A8I9R3_9BACT|nr:hypothetical protein [Corallococcus terminator]RKG76584.1 hypothetical protein D7V88_32045 [Corallococcus terminator]
MGRLEQIEAVRVVLEIVGPLALGLISGALFKKFMYPRVLERMGSRLEGVVTSPANVFLNGLLIGVYLGVAAACHASNAPETVAWLQTHLGLQPSPTLLRIASFVATFFCGYNLATLPSSTSEEDGGLHVDRRS